MSGPAPGLFTSRESLGLASASQVPEFLQGLDLPGYQFSDHVLLLVTEKSSGECRGRDSTREGSSPRVLGVVVRLPALD